MHKVNEAGIIVSPRAHINDAAVSAAMSNLPKDSPVLAALTEFQNAANSALSASTEGELDKVYVVDVVSLSIQFNFSLPLQSKFTEPLQACWLL